MKILVLGFTYSSYATRCLVYSIVPETTCIVFKRILVPTQHRVKALHP